MGTINIVKFKAFMADKCSKIFFDDQPCPRRLELSAALLREAQILPFLCVSLYILYAYIAVMILTCIQEPSSNFDRDTD